ncbi:MAG TPA: VOC family protein [Dehalococcoidia bacterium]|nr:VOC family protein [Dehalococcoidia bacterium]
MPPVGISHIALTVPALAEAETYYAALFGLSVAFREVECGDGWRTLRPGTGWPEATAAGHAPGLSVLHGGGLVLALEAGPAVEQGTLSHVGLTVEPAELDALRGRLEAQRCRVADQRADLLVFADRFGVRWEVAAAPLPPPAQQSGGARLGRWLDLPT